MTNDFPKVGIHISAAKLHEFEASARLRVAAARNSIEAMALSIVWSKSADPSFREASEKVNAALELLREADALLNG